MNKENFTEFLASFKETFIWQLPDCENLGTHLTFSPSLEAAINARCELFFTENENLLDSFVEDNQEIFGQSTGYEISGHKFCLELLGHGCGFFDFQCDHAEELSRKISDMFAHDLTSATVQDSIIYA